MSREDPRRRQFWAPSAATAEVACSGPLALPAAQLNTSWTHRGRQCRHAIAIPRCGRGCPLLRHAHRRWATAAARRWITAIRSWWGRRSTPWTARGSVSAVSALCSYSVALGKLPARSEPGCRMASGGGLAYGQRAAFCNDGLRTCLCASIRRRVRGSGSGSRRGQVGRRRRWRVIWSTWPRGSRAWASGTSDTGRNRSGPGGRARRGRIGGRAGPAWRTDLCSSLVLGRDRRRNLRPRRAVALVGPSGRRADGVAAARSPTSAAIR